MYRHQTLIYRGDTQHVIKQNAVFYLAPNKHFNLIREGKNPAQRNNKSKQHTQKVASITETKTHTYYVPAGAEEHTIPKYRVCLCSFCGNAKGLSVCEEQGANYMAGRESAPTRHGCPHCTSVCVWDREVYIPDKHKNMQSNPFIAESCRQQ